MNKIYAKLLAQIDAGFAGFQNILKTVGAEPVEGLSENGEKIQRQTAN